MWYRQPKACRYRICLDAESATMGVCFKVMQTGKYQTWPYMVKAHGRRVGRSICWILATEWKLGWKDQTAPRPREVHVVNGKHKHKCCAVSRLCSALLSAASHCCHCWSLQVHRPVTPQLNPHPPPTVVRACAHAAFRLFKRSTLAAALCCSSFILLPCPLRALAIPLISRAEPMLGARESLRI